MASTNNITTTAGLPILCNSNHLAPHQRCHHIITGSHGRVWSGCWLSCSDCSFERREAREKARAEREAREAEAEARRRASLQPTERRIYARYPGRCVRCSEPVKVGADIAFDINTRTVRHIDCDPAPARELGPGERVCSLCHEPTRLGMSSPCGTVCPDCYDLAEEGR